MSLSEQLVLKRSKAESLDAVRSLNCWGCNLSDVVLLDKLCNVEVLNLSCNNLTSLKDLRQCNKLTELYIRRNKLSDFSELEHLAHLPNLKVVWLSGNPLSEEPEYRNRVTRILTQISKLDNTDIAQDKIETKQKKGGTEAVLQAVLLLVKELSQSELETVSETVNSMRRQQ